jgi:hypothetical protein
MGRTYDPDGRGTLLVCVACGHEDYSTYYPVRELPSFVSPTRMVGPEKAGVALLRFIQAVDLFREGKDIGAVALAMGMSTRTIHRWHAVYRNGGLAVAS